MTNKKVDDLIIVTELFEMDMRNNGSAMYIKDFLVPMLLRGNEYQVKN